MNALENLARRNQLPFSIDQKKSGRGYTIFEAFLAEYALAWAETFGQARAADISSALAEPLANRWTEIKATTEGHARESEIIGLYAQPALGVGNIAKCGTRAELNGDVELVGASRHGLIREWRVNASVAAAVVRGRAIRLDPIWKSSFDAAPAEYRQRGTARATAKKKP